MVYFRIYNTKTRTRIAKKYAGVAEYESISIYIYGVRKTKLSVYNIHAIFTGRQHSSAISKPCISYDRDVRPSVCLCVTR